MASTCTTRVCANSSSSLNSGVVRRMRLFTRFTTVPKRLCNALKRPLTRQMVRPELCSVSIWRSELMIWSSRRSHASISRSCAALSSFGVALTFASRALTYSFSQLSASICSCIYPCGSISPMRCFSRVIRFVYESMIISTARRLSGVTRPVSSSTVRRSTSMVISVISTEASLLRFGASRGSRKLASSRVTTITPPAMKISSSRMGNHAPPVMVYGIVNINDRVMVPFGPPNVMTAAERQRCAVILRRLPVTVSRARRSINEIHRNRMTITTAETVRIATSSRQLLT